MIPPQCKRLAEVDFPIAVVSKHSAREKSIRHGHPSTLHLWWARRPLAACRAMLLALLLPDPCDEHCPQEFKNKARALLPKVPGALGPKDDDLRKALLKFIGDFADWDLAANPTYLDVSRGLVKAAHSEQTPLVVDPFAGGGSIPLEALRLGCEAFASDLNPVACLILKVMLEDIPQQGLELAENLRRVGAEVRKAAARELAEFYPADPDGAKPIAYLWARTVRCETPNCGAEIPLMRSFWLTKKAIRRRALRYEVRRPKGQPPQVQLEVYQPKGEHEVPGGTVSRAKATCLCCNTVLPPDRVRAQLREQRGGADVIFDRNETRTGGARLLAVVTLKHGETGRQYRQPTERDYAAVLRAMERLQKIVAAPLPNGLPPVPNESTPAGGGSGAGRAFSVQKYGMTTFGDLFTARQKLALVTISEEARASKNASEIDVATRSVLSASISRLADKNASLAVWNQIGEKIEHVFGRQALPIVWDFAEVAIFSDSTGNYESGVDLVREVAEFWSRAQPNRGQVQQGDACTALLPEGSASVWFTDPPYYDAVPYADLSDFFFVWLKRTLPDHPLLRDSSDASNPLTPKDAEAVQDEIKQVHGRPKDRAFFEGAMGTAFTVGRRVLKDDGIGCVVFAHKTTEGWEALLSGMIGGGWTITGSWPIATERPGRLRSQDSAALATSVHLVCRPRTEEVVGDWGDVLRELPKRVRDWMDRLQNEGVRGADLVFACIGPALEIYSRYCKVVDAEEREIPLGGDPEAREPHKRGYLAYVWEVVGRTALEQVLGQAESQARNGVAGVLEEDARLTALFLWTLQGTNGTAAVENEDDENGADRDEEEEGSRSKPKGLSLPFDVVRRFAQPLGIHLPEWEGRITETDKGVVRLLAVSERSKQLFGGDGAQAVADQLEQSRGPRPQLVLFPDPETQEVRVKGRGKAKRGAHAGPASIEQASAGREATTLDRIHAAMLLQRSGRTNALRALVKAEQERGSDFLRLANSLSALYPKTSEEKRLLDAMLFAVPR